MQKVRHNSGGIRRALSKVNPFKKRTKNREGVRDFPDSLKKTEPQLEEKSKPKKDVSKREPVLGRIIKEESSWKDNKEIDEPQELRDFLTIGVVELNGIPKPGVIDVAKSDDRRTTFIITSGEEHVLLKIYRSIGEPRPVILMLKNETGERWLEGNRVEDGSKFPPNTFKLKKADLRQCTESRIYERIPPDQNPYKSSQ